jgi:hypothetical protein
MISLLFFCLAAICNAVMDACVHYGEDTIFIKWGLNTNFWDGEWSWRNKYIGFDPKNGRRKIKGTSINIPVQFTDSWHLFKMFMIIFICLSIVFFESTPGCNWLWYLLMFIVYGIAWNLTFNLFYNKLLIKKK